MRRVAASIALTSAVVLFALAASSARASDAGMLDPLARVSPHVVITNQRTVALYTHPLPLAVNGIEYEMSLFVQQIPGRFGSPDESYMDAQLERTLPTPLGRARQIYDYSFQPEQPFTFTWDHATLSQAGIDAGATIAPDAFQADFTATAPASLSPCRLDGGGTANRRIAPGNVAYGSLSLDTGTSPFFGALSQGSPRGRLVVDPGCSSPFESQSRACSLHELVVGQTGDSIWLMGRLFGKRQRGVEVGFQEQPLASSVAFRQIGSPTGSADVPIATHSASGAHLLMRSGGAPFLHGGAVFTSSRAPRVSAAHTCYSFGHPHRYRVLRYGGSLRPRATPLTALFDTGPMALTRRAATLQVWRYLS
jgi:hypothetical protein